MDIPGVSELLADVKALEDCARAYRSKKDLRMVVITQEEADVIDSYRRFLAKEY
jgi:hypothetical protein